MYNNKYEISDVDIISLLKTAKNILSQIVTQDSLEENWLENTFS